MHAQRSGGGLVKRVGRRSNLIVAAALVATIVGALVSVLRPKSFCAEAKIEVGAVGGLNGEAFLDRVSSAGFKLRSVAELAEVAKAAGADERDARALADRTTVDVRQTEGSNFSVVIGHHAADPDASLKVAAALVERYQHIAVDNSAAEQQKVVEQASAAEAEAKTALDKALAAHSGYVKEHREFLEGARERLQQTRERKTQLQELLEGLKQQKKELSDLLAKERPSVAVKSTDEDGAEKETRVPNEQWIKLDAAVRTAESRLNGATLEMRQAVTQEKALEELARRTPEHEAKAASLAEAESTARKTYEKLAAELLTAETTLTDLRARGALAIRAVEPPTLPSRPSGPGAILLALAGMAAGAVVGTGVAFAKTVSDRSFHRAEMVSGFLGVPSLGAVALIETPSEGAVRRAEKRRKVLLLGALGVAATAAVAFAAAGDGIVFRALFSSAAG
jgi:capsular polysaccharide biosynthesis protein